MKNDIVTWLAGAARELGIDPQAIAFGYPENPEHGDFSSSLALANAKALKTSPKALAEKIAAKLAMNQPDSVASVSVAGPGFINIKLADAAVARAAIAPQTAPRAAGSGSKGHAAARSKVMVEYTDPNPFKVFHIGHLMSNAIGESLSRLIEHSGAEVIRACYQGDVGLHVAKTVWAVMKRGVPADFSMTTPETIADKVRWLGERYAEGASHDDDAAIQKEIAEINKKIFERSDAGVNQIYDYGRTVSLEYFDTIYARLGTKFDRFFFESQVGGTGLAVVEQFLKKGVFEKSEGAVVFKGEEHGLHTRVFVNSHGLPTYEAKEIGLNLEKFKLYPDLAQSVIVTASEQNDYFKVLQKVLSLVAPAVAEKTAHVSHGMLRFASGKMSSRKGTVISAESLIGDVRALVAEKMKGREFAAAEADQIADMVAIAAIKYSILRQAPGGDIIFDSTKSISFEGDSGPYLQYSAVRAQSVLKKAGEDGLDVAAGVEVVLPEHVDLLERLLTRFPDVAARAAAEYAPQHIAGYLISLAGAFNSFYAGNTIVSADEPLSPYRVALTRTFLQTMTDGLWLLGIKVPGRM